MPQETKSEVNNPVFWQEFTLAKIHSLLAVAEAGSLTAAANQEGKQASSISRHIKDLETFFGCKLRQNTGKTAGLSVEGHELALLVRQQLEALKAFRDKATKNLGAVSIVGGDSLLHLILLPKVAEIQKLFPKTKLTVSAMGTFEIIQSLRNYSVDVGLLRLDSLKDKKSDPEDSNATIDYRNLGEYRYAVFVPYALTNGKSLPERDLFSLPFAMIKDHWDINFVDSAKGDGIVIEDIRVWCQNFTQVFRLVRLGQFAGVLPLFCKPLLPKASCLEPAFLKRKTHTMVLAWNPSLLEIRRTTLEPFVEHLSKILRFSS